MAQTSHTTIRNARTEAADFCREILRPVSVENVGKKLPGYGFGKLARHLWPKKTPASISYYTGMPDRTARHVTSTDADPGSIFLAKLIDSDQGWRVLQWIMRNSVQPWWLRVLEDFKHGDKRREAERELQAELLDRVPE